MMQSPALVLVRSAWPDASASVPRATAAGAPRPLLRRTLDGGDAYAWLPPEADVASSLAAALGRAPTTSVPIRLERLRHLDVLGSPAWLAVRATPWSDRVRPRLVNTKRTMFRICS